MAVKMRFSSSGKPIEGETREPDQQIQDIVDEFHMMRFLEQSSYIRPEIGEEESHVEIRNIREELETISGIGPGCVDFVSGLSVANPAKHTLAFVVARDWCLY